MRALAVYHLLNVSSAFDSSCHSMDAICSGLLFASFHLFSFDLFASRVFFSPFCLFCGNSLLRTHTPRRIHIHIAHCGICGRNHWERRYVINNIFDSHTHIDMFWIHWASDEKNTEVCDFSEREKVCKKRMGKWSFWMNRQSLINK